MLMSLLPGLRDLRTPLGVGCLWLFFMWLIWGEAIPSEADATGVVARVYDLLVLVGPGVGLAIVSFLAYLVGAVLSLQWIIERLWLWISYLRMTEPGLQAKVATRRELYARIEQAIDGTHPGDASSKQALVHDRARDLGKEFPDIVMRLQIHESRLFDSYDRKISESDFRVAIFLPLSAIIIALTANTGQPWILLLLIVPTTLMVQGVWRRVEAHSQVYQAVLSGEIESTTLNRLVDEPQSTIAKAD